MKHAICTKESDALDLQSEDDTNAGMPWPGVYLDGTPAPAGQGVTTHLYDPQKHPKEEKWAYPVEDSKDLKGKGSKVDKLSDDWTVTAIEAPKEEPKEEKPIR